MLKILSLLDTLLNLRLPGFILAKDGGTFVEVFGENFLNSAQNLRCGFGTKEVKAYYVNENYLIC
jgi:hypothetical protein